MLRKTLGKARRYAKALLKKDNRPQSFNDRGNARISRIYEGADYLDAYSRHTDLRVDEDPQLAFERLRRTRTGRAPSVRNGPAAVE